MLEPTTRKENTDLSISIENHKSDQDKYIEEAIIKVTCGDDWFNNRPTIMLSLTKRINNFGERAILPSPISFGVLSKTKDYDNILTLVNSKINDTTIGYHSLSKLDKTTEESLVNYLLSFKAS